MSARHLQTNKNQQLCHSEPNNNQKIATALRRSDMMMSEEENLQRITENLPDSSSEDHERLKNKLSTFFKYFSLGKHGWRGFFWGLKIAERETYSATAGKTSCSYGAWPKSVINRGETFSHLCNPAAATTLNATE